MQIRNERTLAVDDSIARVWGFAVDYEWQELVDHFIDDGLWDFWAYSAIHYGDKGLQFEAIVGEGYRHVRGGGDAADNDWLPLEEGPKGGPGRGVEEVVHVAVLGRELPQGAADWERVAAFDCSAGQYEMRQTRRRRLLRLPYV